MGRWFAAALAMCAACSFDRGGSGGGSDGGAPPPDDGGGSDDAGPGEDGGESCTTGALDFSPDEWVSVGDASLDLTDELTVEAWVQPRMVTGEYHIVSRHDASESEGYVLLIKDSVAEFRVYFPDDSGPASHCDCRDTDQELVSDRWVHLAGSFFGGSSYLFVDGALVETCVCADVCTGTCEGETIAAFAGPLTVGIEASRLDRFAADGLIDDVHVRASRQTTAFEPFQAASCVADTLLLFDFEAPVGQELTSGCGAAATGRLGSESGADINDPSAVETDCPPK
ncbi:MAG TPA: LamG domain-containing protein [Kofleriaceae bacterium]|nr:LamG domain-containing protein [Kofleriaceae bacterium]